MFGYVMADVKELDKEQRQRYGSVYCGICRQIRLRSSKAARLALSYDMVFLALLLSSLYEPEEESGKPACGLHPLKPRSWVDSPFVCYAADMNVALAYYKALDDEKDEKKPGSKALARKFSAAYPRIAEEYPRQCRAIEDCLDRLDRLEKENCQNPDEPAGCFGELMAELLVYEEDFWAPTLRKMGHALGRYIYLADAAVDYRKDRRKGRYNPYQEEDQAKWEQWLVLAMGRCTECFERLPLVQDKKILDNILYSGVWLEYRRRLRGEKAPREENQNG